MNYSVHKNRNTLTFKMHSIKESEHKSKVIIRNKQRLKTIKIQPAEQSITIENII